MAAGAERARATGSLSLPLEVNSEPYSARMKTFLFAAAGVVIVANVWPA